ncbi:hypothetical protein ASE01_02335 [Nocardioides sp. Root190]|uniref:sensor histidine kinase n=1 Tax=Nocardioides sp. Root190 TaxID=1736488 RepID=UPI0006F9736B|nr:sensor histidine kinase [Nocardioides sp. Root190]KRB80344.1 hypothetical protein ASE01_02335 [Nocardioides sp. Root190]
MARPDRQPLRLGPRAERWFDLGLTGFLLLPVPVFALYGDLLPAALMLVQIAPLAARRRHPIAVFAVVAAASAAQALLHDEPLWSQLAFPIATYSVARFSTTAWSAAALGTGLVAAAVAAVVWLRGFDVEELTFMTFSAYFVPVSLFVLVAWALGTLGRVRQAYVDALVERGERLQHEAVQQAALAALEERQRIAREMHDVVAHGLTTIVVQAEGARAAATHDPALVVPTLATIASTGREAMAEMRRMLGLLRAEEAATTPQPRLADLATLVDEVRSAGTPVDLDLPDPDEPLSDGVALTAYRVVQESLTNVRKHAGRGARARVRLRFANDAVELEVLDDGRGAASSGDGSGLGLTGMRERVGSHGGDLHAGPAPGGGFRVCARIPR